jgi:hypothetical protein
MLSVMGATFFVADSSWRRSPRSALEQRASRGSGRGEAYVAFFFVSV